MAEVGASVSILTDDRFRGHSLSEGRPALAFDLSYDDAAGIYLGGSATIVATAHSGLRFLEFREYAGYARRIKSGPVLDIGITHSNYTEYFSGRDAADYNEVYIGVITENLSYRIHYSPNYFRTGTTVIYADVDGIVRPAQKWRLIAHFGVLEPIGRPQPAGKIHRQYDWRLGVGVGAGAFDLQLAWTGAGPDSNFYVGRSGCRNAFVFGVTRIF